MPGSAVQVRPQLPNSGPRSITAGGLSFARRLRQAGPGWLDQLAEFDRAHGARLKDGQRAQLQMLLQSRRQWLAAFRVATQSFYWRMSAVDTLILRVLLALRLY